VRDELNHDGYGEYRAAVVMDRGVTFEPRCIQDTLKRIEYYGTTRNDFRLSIRHTIQNREIVKDRQRASFDVHRAYRAFHERLWHSLTAPACDHYDEESQIQLPMGVTTGSALGWDEDNKVASEKIPGRVFVALSKGDSSTRWLAVAMSQRNTVIRGASTCVACAIDYATSLPGKWLVVI
jgi:hypothetical protein